MVGSWSPAAGGETTCTTLTANGRCTMTQGGMVGKDGRPGYIAEVTFTVTSVGGTNIEYTGGFPSDGPVGHP